MAEEIKKHGFIYALSNKNCPDYIYVGCTFDLNERMSKHKHDCYRNRKKYNYKVYKFIRENEGLEKWQYHIIQEYDVKDKRELEQYETYWIKELKSNLNSMKRSFITEEEKKQYQKYYNKKYYQENFDKETERIRKYNQKNKEKIKQLVKQNYEANSERIKEKMKEYSNKRVNCPLCQKEINRGNLSTHKKKYCKMNLK